MIRSFAGPTFAGPTQRQASRKTSRRTSRAALAATLAGALALSTVTTAPARADTTGEVVAAATFLGLVAAAIIASSNSSAAHPGGPALPRVAPPVPDDCRFDIKYGPDRGTWYGRQCLVGHYRGWTTLPGRCLERVDLPRVHYDVTAYDASCLIRYGVPIAGRGHGGNGHGDRH